MTAPGRVCVFAKPPRPGRVKTRLAAGVGDLAAARLARAFLLDTWAGVEQLPWARPVLATTGPISTTVGSLADATLWPQGQGDLGARIERVLQRALLDAEFAIALGTDTPGIPLHLLEQARDALRTADAVIGPCDDGGFYLLGTRACPPGLLEGLPWSQDDTFARTAERLEAWGLKTRVLPRWFDVDRLSDLERLRGLLASGDLDAPETTRALGELRAGSLPGAVSVVLPVLDEQRRIGRVLERLAQTPGLHEIIVVDGGSRDGTLALVREFGGARILSARRGRASQMNEGAMAATGDVLLFLHADVLLPVDAAAWVRRALADRSVVAGAFRTWTVPEVGAPAWLAPLLHLADVRSRYSGLPYGDQALFVRREVFERLGGYADIDLMEDLELSRRLRREGRIVTVPAEVEVSGRRFQERPIYSTLLVNLFPALYRLGVPPRFLGALYGAPR